MVILFNIGVIAFVLIIAYWWANQGLFSAILHLVSVIAAGAIALSVWEPLVVGFMLRDTAFDNYAWGVTLVGVFAVTLFVLRLALDRLAPANVDLPHWANLAFGFPIGAAAGVITMGIVVLGCGFIQSHVEIVGYRGYLASRGGEIVKDTGKPMWLPVHQWTAEFYGWLSVTSMWSNRPLRQYYPRLHWQSSLIRSSYNGGRGQISLAPQGAEVRDCVVSAAERRVAVTMHFNAAALDFGEQLTISKAQIRLISHASGQQKARVVHPDSWRQGGSQYLFDDPTHYITSTPGQESTDATIIFSIPADFVPRFIQVKGTRYRLQPREGSISGAGAGGGAAAVSIDPTAPVVAGDEIRVSNAIRPIRASANSLPGTITEQDRYFVDGYGTFFSGRAGGATISRNLLIQGVYEPAGTRIVTLDVSRNSPADIYAPRVQNRIQPEQDQMALIDASGNRYSPIGYMHDLGNGQYEIKLAPGRYLRTFDEVPYLPTSGTQSLKLFFRVTQGVDVVAFQFGQVTVARCNLSVPRN